MYIKYKNKQYHCGCRPGETMVYSGLPEDFPAPVDGEIVLCRDDGFEMRRDSAADYIRQTFEGGTLTLTNLPEPEPAPDPEPAPEPVPDPEPEYLTVEDMKGALSEGVNKI